MDILDNIATELGFEFHLYIVQDEMFGGKLKSFKDGFSRSRENDELPLKSQQSTDARSASTGTINKNKKPGRKKGYCNYNSSLTPYQ